MSIQRVLTIAGAAMTIGALSAPAIAADAIPKYVADAVGYMGRPPSDSSRDAVRKPAEVVAFSGIKPGDKVADVNPGGGYYTRILSRVVGPNGKVYAYVPNLPPPPAPAQPQAAAAPGAAPAAPQPPRPRPIDNLLTIQNSAVYSNVVALLAALGGRSAEFSVPEQLDAVWTSDNYHDFHNARYSLDMPRVNAAIYRALKSGGTYFVLDHAAAPGTGFTVTETLHRADPEAVKKEVIAAGFVLDGESKALAHPADDHSKRIFDGDMRGNTDHFILRFKKPANAANTDMRPKDNPMDTYFGNTLVTNIGLRGQVSGQRERRVFYWPDMTYQEMGPPNTGNNVFQEGLIYWDADGKNCMLHQIPVEQRGFVVCNSFEPHKKPGDKWISKTDREIPYTLIEGLHYPE